MMMRYQCAILEVQTKLQVLNNDMSVRHSRNPIEFVKTRIKSPKSIAEKLKRNGLEISVGNMVRHLNDVAGVRVVCSFIDDIYEVAHMLARQNDVKVIQVKDYIKNPKENGYRSYNDYRMWKRFAFPQKLINQLLYNQISRNLIVFLSYCNGRCQIF